LHASSSSLIFISLLIRRPPRHTPFPYTTLFRSSKPVWIASLFQKVLERHSYLAVHNHTLIMFHLLSRIYQLMLEFFLSLRIIARSEEHTSELQSRENLVCRLLLEKRKSPSRSAI